MQNLQKTNMEKLSSTAHEILGLFTEKTELSMPEIVQKQAKMQKQFENQFRILLKKDF